MIPPEDAANIGILAALERRDGLNTGALILRYCHDRNLSVEEVGALMGRGAAIFRSLMFSFKPVSGERDHISAGNPKDPATSDFLRRWFKP